MLSKSVERFAAVAKPAMAGLVVAVFSLTTASPARATFFVNFTDPAVGANSLQGNDGFRFQSSAPILVTALGYYDRNQDGLTLSHPVGIYDTATQVLLAQTTVGPSSSLDGLFRYNAITPLSLAVSQSYTVVGFHPGSTTQDLAASNPSGLSLSSGLTLQGYFFNLNPSLSFTTTNGDPSRFFGPNFQFQPAVAVVPVPASQTLLGLGLLGVLSRGWQVGKRPKSVTSI